MATLTVTTICSLDGYIADAQGDFDWAAPDEQVHAFVNDLQCGVGTYLYGSGRYETMRFWELRQRCALRPLQRHDRVICRPRKQIVC